jgi:hypothetical protein
MLCSLLPTEQHLGVSSVDMMGTARHSPNLNSNIFGCCQQRWFPALCGHPVDTSNIQIHQFSQQQTSSHLEFVWVACGRDLLNSAKGGEALHYWAPPDLEHICCQTLSSLPKRISSKPDDILSAWLACMIEEEAKFLDGMRERGWMWGWQQAQR